MHTWSEIKSEFEADGSLRDIYISPANEDLWNRFIELIGSSSYTTEFQYAGKLLEFPQSFGSIRDLQHTNPAILHIWIGENIHVICHFFTADEIEMDLTPSEVNSERCFNSLYQFLCWLSNSLNVSVKLTHEGAPNMIICEVESNGV